MRKSFMSAAIVLAASSALSHGQIVTNLFTENFDDGAAASRWDFVARENGVDPAAGTPDGLVNFNFDYSSATYTHWGLGSQQPIGAAPSGGGTTGVLVRVNDGNGSVTANAIAQAGILPKNIVTSGDYRLTLDMFANNSDPNASGSSEFALIGLNADAVSGSAPTLIVGDNLPTGSATPAIAANATANGYAFASGTEGGFAGDYRVYARKLPGDDAPRYAKRNAAWTGTSRQPLFDSGGTYIGTETNPEEGFNTYYHDLSPGNANGPFLGGVGKSWVKVDITQRGSIVYYSINDKIINTLFVPAPVSGKVQVGAYDAAASTPADVTESYFLFDNIKLDSIGPAAPNTISASDNFARMNAGGTVTINGAATLAGLQFDTAATTLAGTGAITLGPASGAIYAGGGVAHTLSKPITINADTAVFVNTPTDTLSISNASWGTDVDFHKVGQGTLELNKFSTKSLTITSGKVKMTSPGVNKTNLLYFEYQPADPTPPADYPAATINSGVLDINRSVIAVDYSNATTVANPTTPISPYSRLLGRLIAGFRPDAANNGQPRWDGPGIVTSAPDLQGANYFTALTTIRVTEASTIGYADGSTIAGVPIDATTVLIGYTYKTDVNMDQAINFDDLLKLAQNYGTDYTADLPTTGVQWWRGDSNGDGLINFDDLLALAQAYGGAVTLQGLTVDADLHAAFDADRATAFSMVPEPTSLAALAMGGLLVRRRR